MLANLIRTAAARIRAVLPARWFADDAPVLGAVLAGFDAGCQPVFAALEWVALQARLATATGGWLDARAWDFMAGRLLRRPGEDDPHFSARLRREVIRPRVTRAAVTALLTDLSGTAPRIFEPGDPRDTGGYGMGWGWGVAGGWGSLAVPAQCLIEMRRPAGQGVPDAAGWGSPAGGWGMGALQWAPLDGGAGQVTDAETLALVGANTAAGVTAWTRITA